MKLNSKYSAVRYRQTPVIRSAQGVLHRPGRGVLMSSRLRHGGGSLHRRYVADRSYACSRAATAPAVSSPAERLRRESASHTRLAHALGLRARRPRNGPEASRLARREGQRMRIPARFPRTRLESWAALARSCPCLYRLAVTTSQRLDHRPREEGRDPAAFSTLAPRARELARVRKTFWTARSIHERAGRLSSLTTSRHVPTGSNSSGSSALAIAPRKWAQTRGVA